MFSCLPAFYENIKWQIGQQNLTHNRYMVCIFQAASDEIFNLTPYKKINLFERKLNNG